MFNWFRRKKTKNAGVPSKAKMEGKPMVVNPSRAITVRRMKTRIRALERAAAETTDEDKKARMLETVAHYRTMVFMRENR